MKIKFFFQSNKLINWYKRAYAGIYLKDADQMHTLLCKTNMIFNCEI